MDFADAAEPAPGARIDPVALWAEASWLRRLAASLGCEPAAAEDLVQETLLSASERLDADDPRPVRGWLARALRRRHSMEQRSAVRRETRERAAARPESDDLDPAALLARQELDRRLRAHVAALPQADREVLALRHAADLSPAAIAKALGTTPNAVSSRLSRAHRRLRERLEADESRSSHRGGFAWPLAGLLRSSLPFPLATLLMKKPVVAAFALLVALLASLPLVLDGDAPARVAGDGRDIEVAADPELQLAAVEPGADRAVATGLPDVEPTPTSTPVEPAAEEASGAIDVLVREAVSGKPAAGVEVELVRFRSGAYWAAKRRVVTDSLGRASFEDVRPGEVYLYMEAAPGPGEGGSEQVVVSADERREVSFVVDDQAGMVGRVVDPLGVPVPGAAIWVAENAGAWPWGHVVTRADEEGRFELPYLRSYTMVSARAEGYGPSTAVMLGVEMAELDPKDVVLRLGARSGTVFGILRDADGAPRADVEVFAGRSVTLIHDEDGEPTYTWTAAGSSVRTDAEGAFVIAGLDPGTYQVSARLPDTALAASEVEVLDGVRTEVDLTLSSGATLLGRLSLSDGTPLADADVRVRETGRSPFERVETRTDSEGRFRLDHLGPGTVGLEFEKESGERVGAAEFETAEGEVIERSWTFEPPTRFEGTLKSASGEPLSRWYIGIRPSGEPGAVTNGAFAKADGSFMIPRVEAARVDVEVQAPGTLFLEPALFIEGHDPSTGPIDLVVSDDRVPSGGLRCVVRTPDGDAVPFEYSVQCDALDQFHAWGSSKGEGPLELNYLPNESLRLVIEAKGYARFVTEMSDPLDAGEIRDLGELVLRPASEGR